MKTNLSLILRGIKDSLAFPKRKVLFLFLGGHHCWGNMGRILYEEEKAFRKSIQETSELIAEFGQTAILPNFQGKAAADFFEDYSSQLYNILAVQMALADLWKAEGILPSAVFGFSLGETSALYAAQGIDRRAAVQMATGRVMTYTEYSPEFVVVVVKSAFRDPVFEKFTGLIHPICEWSQTETLAICREQELDRAADLLRQHHIGWKLPELRKLVIPLHSPLIRINASQLEEYCRGIEPQPTVCDFYSCTLGQKVPAKATVPVSLFGQLPSAPILFHSAFRLALQDNFDAILNLGTYSFKYEFEQEDDTGKAAVPAVFNSISLSRPDEAGHFKENHRALKKHLSGGWRRYFQ
ncbi:MAG: hypothetical protein RI973_324 [Bacteroidota bacterium]|jgi:myxalamid-type polyketide synthase MxaE and MxaD